MSTYFLFLYEEYRMMSYYSKTSWDTFKFIIKANTMVPYEINDLKYSPSAGLLKIFCPANGETINSVWKKNTPSNAFRILAFLNVAPPASRAAAEKTSKRK